MVLVCLRSSETVGWGGQESTGLQISSIFNARDLRRGIQVWSNLSAILIYWLFKFPALHDQITGQVSGPNGQMAGQTSARRRGVRVGPVLLRRVGGRACAEKWTGLGAVSVWRGTHAHAHKNKKSTHTHRYKDELADVLRSLEEHGKDDVTVTHTRTCTLTRTHARARARTHTHTHKQASTHAHTHIHTQE